MNDNELLEAIMVRIIKLEKKVDDLSKKVWAMGLSERSKDRTSAQNWKDYKPKK